MELTEIELLEKIYIMLQLIFAFQVMSWIQVKAKSIMRKFSGRKVYHG